MAQPTVPYPDAIRRLRADPAYADLVRDAYLDQDVVAAAARFRASGEWAEVRHILGDRITGAAVLDLGAGTGMASAAFADAGAVEVIALEPEGSEEGGRPAIAKLARSTIRVVDGTGESIPLPDQSVDIVYVRQTLHHAADLPRMLSECGRILRPGGRFLACREHVVDNDRQLADFLASHPVHRLAGGENAFSLSEYEGAIWGAGLRIDEVLGPWDSVINAFPLVDRQEDLRFAAARRLAKLGRMGRMAAQVPGVTRFVRFLVSRHSGRLYTFIATKPRRS